MHPMVDVKGVWCADMSRCIARQVALPLLPMLVGGQKYIDEQDEQSVTKWMLDNGLPPRINEEVRLSLSLTRHVM